MIKPIWFILILMVAFCIHLVTKPGAQVRQVPKEILTIPNVDLLLTDSQTVINTANAKKGKATVFFYFDPNCDHCQQETEDIIANKEILKNANFYFITLDTLSKARKFLNHYQLYKYPEIILAKDYMYKGMRTFKLKSIPTNFVYNKEHVIVKIFEGSMSVSDLRKVLNI